jgi:integrase
MIRKVYSKRHRDGWHYDQKRRQCWSWAFDIRRSGGRRQREAGFLSREEADNAVRAIRRADQESKYGVLRPFEYPQLSELVAKHVARIENHNEQIRATRVLNVLCSLLPRTMRLNELQTAHLQLLIDRRRQDGQSGASIDREMNIVSSALHAAPLYFPALSNWQPPRIPRPKHSHRRRERLIALAEATKLLTWLYRERVRGEALIQERNRRTVGHVFRLALLTASRKGELCKLRWDQIDWAAGQFQILGTKTAGTQEQTARYPKITDTIAAIFRERRAIVPPACRYVFTSRGGEVTHYYAIMVQAAEACGLLYGRKTLGGFVTHDTRHTAVTYLMQAGHDLKTIAALTGHSDKAMVMLYSHATRASVDAACEALEAFAGTGTLGLGGRKS